MLRGAALPHQAHRVRRHGARAAARGARPLTTRTRPDERSGPRRARRLAGALLLSQPLTIVVQLVVATRWRAGEYRLDADTISELGAIGCTSEVCSPWHALMNAAFVALGVALALAGLVLAGLTLVVGLRAVGALLVVAGVSSAAVGFVPLDVDGGLHAQVATPLFVAQPLALLLLAAVLLRRSRRVLGVALAGAGVVAAVGAVGFGVLVVAGAGGGDEVGGLLERVALWPCHLGLAAAGAQLLRRRLWQDRVMSGQVDSEQGVAGERR